MGDSEADIGLHYERTGPGSQAVNVDSLFYNPSKVRSQNASGCKVSLRKAKGTPSLYPEQRNKENEHDKEFEME